jgi:hypothetical protein
MKNNSRIACLVIVLLVLTSCAKKMDLDSVGYVGTPKTGIAIVQHDREIQPELLNNGVAKYEIENKPFVIFVPITIGQDSSSSDNTQVPIQICASLDEKIFTQIRKKTALSKILCYKSGTGMAQRQNESPQDKKLIVGNGNAHNYFSADRRIDGKQYSAIYIKEIRKRYGAPIRSGTIYMIIFKDRNADKVVDEEEYELFMVKIQS